MKAKHLFLCVIAFISCSAQAKPTLTVFIHGTVAWYLALTSPSWLQEGTVSKGSLYEAMLHQTRNDPSYYEQKMMLGVGFREISSSLLEAARKDRLSYEHSRFGCYYMIAGYDTIARGVGYASEEDHYALFGWLGMNTRESRLKESFELYRSLANWRDDYQAKHGIIPAIRIVAYSHAGNVALGLVQAEQEYKRALQIEQLCLLATPIQVETARYILSPLFSSIILLRSPEGDDVQTADSFSTSTGESFAFLSDVVNMKQFKHRHPTLQRADVGIWINRDGQAVNHFNFFELGAQSLHEVLDPLPVVVLVPALLQYLNRHPEHLSLRARILCEESSVKVQIKSGHQYTDYALSISDDLYEHVNTVKQFTTFWRPQQKPKPRLKENIKRVYKDFLSFFSDDDENE